MALPRVRRRAILVFTTDSRLLGLRACRVGVAGAGRSHNYAATGLDRAGERVGQIMPDATDNIFGLKQFLLAQSHQIGA